MDESQFKQKIREMLPNREQWFAGFADLSGLLSDKFTGFDYAVVVGRCLDNAIIDKIKHGPTREYYAHYQQVNQELSLLIKQMGEQIKSLGSRCMGMEPTVLDQDLDDTYWENLRVDFSHKMAATRGGLGWIGKTDLFISTEYGPRLRLAVILTDFPLTPDQPPIDKSRCGACLLCVEACPAQAANGKLWNVRVDRDEFFNAFKCRINCREQSWELLGEKLSICGICVAVCPIGREKEQVRRRSTCSF